MKKSILSLLLSAAMLTPAIMSAAYDGKTWDKTWNSSRQTLTAATEEKAKDWMADLPDNMFVAHVSIPGTHDSATGDVPAASMGASTQDAKIDEMLNRGVRAFDFRPGWYNNKLHCYHSSFRTNYTFEDAMSLITNFLDAHSNEFVFFHLFPGNVESGSRDASAFTAALETMFNTTLADHVVAFRPDRNVRDVRGKIIVFQRDKLGFVDIQAAGYINGWHKGFENGNGLTVYNALDHTLLTSLVVQDWSDGGDDMETKKTDCEALLNWSSAQTTPNDGFNATGSYLPKFAMNFTSRGNTSLSYNSSARTMNPFVNEWFDAHKGEGPVGIIMSDRVLRNEYEGSDLIYNIIENNFWGGENAPVVRYAINEKLDWDSPVVYLRNVGSGLYLAAGGRYGTHAVLDNHGIQLKLLSDDSGLRFRTGFKQWWAEDGFLGHDCYIDNWQATQYFSKNPIDGTTYFQLISWDGSALAYIPDPSVNSDYLVDLGNNGTIAIIETVESNPSDPNQYWEVMTMSDILNRAFEGSESGEEYSLSMLNPESHNYVSDPVGVEALWSACFTQKNNAYAQQWGSGEEGEVRRVTRLATNPTSNSSGNSYTWEKTIKNVPNGNYRFELLAAASNFDPKSASGFSFTVNDVEIKDLIYKVPDSYEVDGVSNPLNCEAGAYLFNHQPTDISLKENFVVKDGTIKIKITKGGDTGGTSFFMDDLSIIYLGKEQISFDVDFPMYYNTLTLPFDVEEGVLPGNLHAFLATGVTEASNEGLTENGGEEYKFHVVQLSEEVKELKANTPYIVINDNGQQLPQDAAANGTPAAKAPSRAADASNTVTFTGFAHYNDAVAGLLTGTHSETTVDDGHYVLSENPDAFQTFAKVDSASDENSDTTSNNVVGAHRAYVNVGNTDVDLEHTLITFNAQIDNVLTGVESVGADASEDAPVEYYNLQGVRVMNPQQGIYIRRQGTKVEKFAL